MGNSDPQWPSRGVGEATKEIRQEQVGKQDETQQRGASESMGRKEDLDF